MFAVGFVHRPHGVKGEASVESLGSAADPFEPGRSLVWIRGERSRELKVSARRIHGRRWLVSFEGVGNAESVRELSGGVLCAPQETLPDRGEDFFWTHEVKGWSCEDRTGRALGSVVSLEETPAGPQLTLETSTRREVLVPFVRPIVVEVDRASRRIVLDPPEGLMEL
jgi:16S rRNA processing protein RimM